MTRILVKLTFTGMCHSEWYPWSTAKAGDVFGHETIGAVAKTGANVQGFSVGDRVSGLGGGGYKEYIVMDPAKTVHVPDNVKDEDALVEPLACMLSVATKMPPAIPGDRVAVVGTGYMGRGRASSLSSLENLLYKRGWPAVAKCPLGSLADNEAAGAPDRGHRAGLAKPALTAAAQYRQCPRRGGGSLVGVKTFGHSCIRCRPPKDVGNGSDG